MWCKGRTILLIAAPGISFGWSFVSDGTWIDHSNSSCLWVDWWWPPIGSSLYMEEDMYVIMRYDLYKSSGSIYAISVCLIFLCFAIVWWALDKLCHDVFRYKKRRNTFWNIIISQHDRKHFKHIKKYELGGAEILKIIFPARRVKPIGMKFGMNYCFFMNTYYEFARENKKHKAFIILLVFLCVWQCCSEVICRIIHANAEICYTFSLSVVRTMVKFKLLTLIF